MSPYPKEVCLEASSVCQLRCPICPTGKQETRNNTIGQGYLKFKDFKIFIDKNPHIKNIELSNFGEIFLNPELKQIIRYAYIHGVKLTARNGVNLNNTDKETLKFLVRYNFECLSVSMDGASNQTYKLYRIGGDFNKVIKNIKTINRHKKTYHSDLPRLWWQFIIFGHNEHELPKARSMAAVLGMKFVPKLNWDPSFSPVINKEFVRKESGLGVASREEYSQKNQKNYILPCTQLWSSPQINWDGRLLGCCSNDNFGDFGVNVFKIGLENALKSEKYVYAKDMLSGKKPPRSDIPCSKCKYYLNFLKDNKKTTKMIQELESKQHT